MCNGFIGEHFVMCCECVYFEYICRSTFYIEIICIPKAYMNSMAEPMHAWLIDVYGFVMIIIISM